MRYGEVSEQHKTKLSNCDVFIHCGALLHGSFDDLFNSNVLLTKSILDYLNKRNPDVHFIYLSSMSLLQKKKNISSYDYNNFNNMSPYALSKYISEILCLICKIPVTVVRFSTLFYKDQSRDGLSKLIYDAVKKRKITIFNNGEAKRDFLPLDIAAQYIVKLLKNKKHMGETLNIVSGKETSFKDIADFLNMKIRDLIIEDKTLKSSDNVPTNFNCEDICSLGRIKFDLFGEVDDYHKELLREKKYSNTTVVTKIK